MKLYLKQIILIWLAGVGLLGQRAWAQGEYRNWYFGQSAGVTFNTPAATALSNGQLTFQTGVASMSNGAGQLQFVADGSTIWDRNWQPMSRRISTHPLVGFSTRQVLAVRQPGTTNRYYVFRSSNQFTSGQYPVSNQTRLFMPYAVVDMQARGGLGDVVATDSLRLPNWTLHLTAPYYYPNTNFTAVRHANGRDLWLVVQTDEGQLASYLLSPTGLAAQPVVSLTPRSIFTVSNGILKAASDGRTLASITYFGDRNQASTTLEIISYDPATGTAGSFYTLPDRYRGRIVSTSPNQWVTYFVRVSGLEFSPDGSKLYADTVGGNSVLQYDLLAGTPTQVAASRRTLSLGSTLGFQSGDMQLAPDGRIYISQSNNWLARIETPNLPGPAAGLTRQAVNLGLGRTSSYTLPYATNDLDLPPVVISGAGSIGAGEVCAGTPLQLLSSLSPFVTAASYAWDFGDPASGVLNTAAGQAPVHTYRQGGQYTVTLRVTAVNAQQFVTTQQVRVLPRPSVSLGPDAQVCADAGLVLSPGPQPAGSTFRWHDGSTGATLRVSGTGVYSVAVTSPSGCVGTDSVAVTMQDCPDLPNIITPNGDGQNDAFRLKGLNAPDWRCRLFNRWGRLVFEADAYQNDWSADGQTAGVYFYELINRQTGQRRKGWVEVVR